MYWFGKDNKSFDFDMFSLSHFVILSIFILIAVSYFPKSKKIDEWWEMEKNRIRSSHFFDFI